MTTPRKNTNPEAAKDVCLKLLSKLDKSGTNTAHYKELFNNMNPKQFDEFMEGLISGTNPLQIFKPNFSKVNMTADENVAFCRSLGRDLYQRIWITDETTGIRFLSNWKHLVYPMVVSRQIQIHDHKISVAENNRSVDPLTGQPSGKSRKSQQSGPETNVMRSKGYEATLVEFLKVRGGDNKSMRYADQQIIRTGQASMKDIPGINQRQVTSVMTLSSILQAMGLDNNYAARPQSLEHTPPKSAR